MTSRVGVALGAVLIVAGLLVPAPAVGQDEHTDNIEHIFNSPQGEFFQDVETCTAHNFNFIPVRDRYVLVSCFYGGGTSIVDFTAPAAPEEMAFYDAEEADTWSSYWFNGYIYANDIARGLDVFKLNEGFTKDAVKWRKLNPQTQLKTI